MDACVKCSATVSIILRKINPKWSSGMWRFSRTNSRLIQSLDFLPRPFLVPASFVCHTDNGLPENVLSEAVRPIMSRSAVFERNARCYVYWKRYNGTWWSAMRLRPIVTVWDTNCCRNGVLPSWFMCVRYVVVRKVRWQIRNRHVLM